MATLHRRLACLSAAAVVALAAPHVSAAQNRNAVVSGIVRDSTGAILPGATVTIRTVATNQTRNTVTDDHGRYAFPNQDIGEHEIVAEITGFQAARVKVELTVGQNAQLDLTLQPGTLSESLIVTANALGVDTRSSTFGQLVSRGQIEKLPLNGRDFSQLILLQPGTTAARSDVGDILTGKGSKISVHGARTSQNAYMLDGTDILDALGRSAGSAQGLVSGIESVQEFTVLTNTYAAEYGRAAGGVFNIATKSGSNAVHGSVFEFFRHSKLDARNYFDVEQPPFRRNQYGGSAGGPIVHDRTFFFGSFEGLRERLGLTQVEAVPSLAARRGAFLPAGARINPAVVPYLDLIPEPTVDNPNGEKATWTSVFTQHSALDAYNGRIDHNLSQHDSLFSRYTQNDSDLLFINSETFPTFPNRGRNRQKFLTVSESHVFSRNVVSSLRYAFNRTTPLEEPAPTNGYENLAFIPGQIVGDFLITGYRRFGSDRNTPRSFFQDVQQVAGDVTIIRGSHALKFGMNAEHFDIRGNSASRNRGEYTINTFSDFLQGRSRDFVGLAPGADDTIRHHRQSLFGMYAQDDWRMGDLTLNIGMRYEFVTTPNEVNGKITNVRAVLDPGPTVGAPLFQNPTVKNFAPRAGFAYAPSSRDGWLGKLAGGPNTTVIRGGFGIYYDPLLYSTYGNMTFKHEPYFKQIRILNAPFPDVYPLLASGQGLIDTFALQFDPASTYVEQYNVNVQRALSPATVVTIGYVGSHGLHLWREADFNNALPLNPPDNTRFPATGTPARRNPNFANIRLKVSDGTSSYNALLLGLQTRIGSAFRGQLSYTYGKSIDDQSSSLGRNEFANGQARTVDPYNRRLNRGRSDFDVRHNLSVNFSYDIPFGAGRAHGADAPAAVRALIGGWQVSGILAAQSGIAVSPIFTFDQDRDATTDNEQRPNLAPNVTRISAVSATQLFDPTVFVLPPAGTRGTVGRNTIEGPGLVTFDPAFVKSFDFGKDARRSAQLRIEMFNALNRVNFSIPSVANLTIFNSPTERNSTAGQITSTSTPARQVQLALRIVF